MKGAKRAGKRTDISASRLPFDDEGVRLAILAAIESIYESFPNITLPQYLIALEVRRAEQNGAPHTLASLVYKFKMPFSTASRVVWSLTEEGGDIGVIRYLGHPTDRRKKQLMTNRDNLLASVPTAAIRAMIAYYGDSVRHLDRRD
jgi:hypothetical protein